MTEREINFQEISRYSFHQKWRSSYFSGRILLQIINEQKWGADFRNSTRLWKKQRILNRDFKF